MKAAFAFAVVAVFAGCGFQPGTLAPSDSNAGDDDDASGDAQTDAAILLDAAEAPWLSTHGYRKPMQVSPGGAAAALASFPVPVRIATDANLVAHARTDATDLVVTTDDGTTVLPHELAYYDPATGEAELWVLVPTLQLDAVTSLFLYYGGPAGSPNGAAVWTNGYKGVWHISGLAAATTEVDSTAAANHLSQATAANVPAGSAGASATGTTIGRARAFDGTNDALTVPDPANGSLDVGSTAFSVSLWVNSAQSNGLYDTPLYKGGTNGGNYGYSVFAGTSAWAGKLMDQTSTFINPQFSATQINGRWVHLVMSIQRSPSNVATTYLDGAKVGTLAFNLQSFDGTAGLALGGVTAMFQGAIDEVRVYSQTLSDDWVATEYASLTKPGFIVLGAERTP